MGKGLASIRKGEGKHMLSTKAGKVVSAEVQFDMETKLNLITKRAIEDKRFKFTSLAHLLNEVSLKELHLVSRQLTVKVTKFQQYVVF